MQYAPLREASVSITISGVPETRPFPFHASKLSLHQVSSSNARGGRDISESKSGLERMLRFLPPVSAGSEGELEKLPG